MMLSQGKIVNKAAMFGIVCSMKMPQKVIIKLSMNIDKQECNFFQLVPRVPFDTVHY